MELSTIKGRVLIEGQNPALEGRKHFARQPRAKNPPLFLVAPFKSLNSDLELENCDTRDIEMAALDTAGPRFQVFIDRWRAGLTKFGNDICIQQIQN